MVTEHDGAHDFDFLMGAWKVHNRRLQARLKGSSTWDEFEATNVARPLLAGAGNEDEYRTGFAGGFVGMSFRFYDRATKRWAIYWADSRKGVLEPPVYGSFADGQGVFLGTDTLEGRPIQVRFIWSRLLTPSPRWEQAFSEDGGKTWETNWVMDMTRDAAASKVAEESAFPVVELRRYETKVGEEQAFARYFESFFPEAFQQLGAIVFGQFLERGRPSSFTWLRGYRSLAERAVVGAAFYDGPVWKEHKQATNARIVDSGNVLLLAPLRPERGISFLPAVDDTGDHKDARGVVVAQIFAAQAGRVDALAAQAEGAFAGYRGAGAREAGVLVTLDVPNNFPRHPIRTDGPYLVWLGVLENDAALSRFRPVAVKTAQDLKAAGLLRAETELVVLDPTPRSRLRWLSEGR
jgi:NIPSNAP